MKNFITTVLIISVFSCKAQSPIVGLDAPYETPEGAYYKDLNDELDKFVGTWKYIGTNSEFTIVLQKLLQVQILNDFYDTLDGEYSYSENNVEIVNTLPLNLESEGNIGGSYIIDDNNYLSCDDCNPNERRIRLYFNDPERDYLNVDIVLRYIEGSNPEQIQVTIFLRDGGILPYVGAPTVPRVPLGEYLMTKQ